MFRFACVTVIALNVLVDALKSQTTDAPDLYRTQPYSGGHFRTTPYYSRHTTGYYGDRNTARYGTHSYGDFFRTTPYSRRFTGSSDDYYRNFGTTRYYRNWNTDSYGNLRTDRYRTRGYGHWFTTRYPFPYGSTEIQRSEFTDSETGERMHIFSPHFIARSAYNAIQSTINYLKSLISR